MSSLVSCVRLNEIACKNLAVLLSGEDNAFVHTTQQLRRSLAQRHVSLNQSSVTECKPGGNLQRLSTC